MEGLNVDTIPTNLLGRILLQLHTLPRSENINLLSIMQDALQQYGYTNDLNAFLDYCQKLVVPTVATSTDNGYGVGSQQQSTWLWETYEIKSDDDWDLANYKKAEQLVGVRFVLTSTTARKGIELTRFSQVQRTDDSLFYSFQGRMFPIEDLINDTLYYFQQKCSLNDQHDAYDDDKEGSDGMTGSEIEKSGLLNILQERSDKCRQDRLAFQKRSNALDHANYHLMGVLLVRLEDVALSKPTANTWCLYLRDYRGNNADGSLWRVISKDKEEQATISSDQALADITGQIYGYCNPTVFSRDYRPAYLFYGNIDMLDQSSYSPVAQVDSIKQQQAEEHCNNQDTRNNGGTITFADYTFDDDGYDPNDFGVDYAYSATEAPIEDDTACYHCGKKDEFPNNDIFLCDLCNQGFHQLCEDPPIDNSEIQLDPWYCRTCSKAQNIPLPNLPSSSTRSPCYETTTTSTNITEQKASIPSIEHTNTTAAAHNTAISYTSPLPSNNMSETTSKYFSVENTEASKAEVDDNGDDSLYNNLTKRKRNDEAIVNNHPNNNSRGRNNTARRSRPFQRKLDHF